MLIGQMQDVLSLGGEARMNFPNNSGIYWLSLSSYEWIAITRSISDWFKEHIDEPSFLDCVYDRYKKAVES